MITKEDWKDSSICFRCKESIINEVSYKIWVSPHNKEVVDKNYKLSQRISFHKKCFLEMAGEEYEFEGY